MFDGKIIENGTIKNMKKGKNIIGALPNASMLFTSFQHGNITTTDNPYILTGERDTVIWCIFRRPASITPEDQTDLADELAAVILFSLFLFVLGFLKKNM